MTFHRVFAVGTLVLLSCCSFGLIGCKPAEGIHQVRVKAEYSERRDANPSLPAATGEAPDTGGVKYTTPAGWTVAGPHSMRMATLTVAEGNQKCEITLSSLGPGQPVLGNVNRWREQVGLAEIIEADLQLTPVRSSGIEGSLVQLVGETKTILAVIIPRPDSTVFVKLIGENALALREREKFVAFTESIELP